jgi:hypothetical protein
MFQALEENNCQSRLVYPAKLSFLTEGEIKALHNKEKLKEFTINNPRLQKILQGLLQTEIETTVSRKN